MTNCLGFKITTKLQTLCPKRFECKKYLDQEAKEVAVQPRGTITENGCSEYKAKNDA